MKKSFKNFLSVIAIVLSLCFTLTACKPSNGGNNSGNSSGTTEKVTVAFADGEAITIDEWTTKRISATASDKSAVTFEVADKTVVYLRGSNLTGLKAGTTTVTARGGKKKDATAVLTVTVNEKPENRPALTLAGEENLAIGKTTKFTATLSNADAADYTVKYGVSDATKATVDESGNVTATAAGVISVTAETTYRSVTFKDSKQLTISQIVRVVFDKDATEATLALSEIKEGVTGDYTLTINGKTYVADSDGNITLAKADFETASTDTFDGTLVEGDNTHEFKIKVFIMGAAKVYQDGTLLIAGDNGNYTLDKTAPADGNGQRWVTFDDAATMVDFGYELLRIKVKFNQFINCSAGFVYSGGSSLTYSFGYKYGSTFVFFDNAYNNQFYGGAMQGVNPYGYGYVRIYNATGKQIFEYYEDKMTDGAGTHGGWSSSFFGYIPSLSADEEYIIEIDASKTGDIEFSGLDNAEFSVEWTKKVKTVVEFAAEEINVEQWKSEAAEATVNDGSAIVYEVEDPTVAAYKDGKIYGLKEGETTLKATANGVEATVTVKVSANEVQPVLTVNADTEVRVLESFGLTYKLALGENEIPADSYNVTASFGTKKIAALKDGKIIGGAEGETVVNVTAEYFGIKFENSFKCTVTANADVADKFKAKIYKGETELTAGENGEYVIGGEASDKLTFDKFSEKSAEGFSKLRLKVKFGKFENSNVTCTGGACSFAYSFGDTQVGWWNNYNDATKGMSFYVGGFSGTNTAPVAFCYLRVYEADGETEIFEHYEVANWSSSGYGYVPSLVADTEYVFEIDCAKTGDVTVWGFNFATITEASWSIF